MCISCRRTEPDVRYRSSLAPLSERTGCDAGLRGVFEPIKTDSQPIGRSIIYPIIGSDINHLFLILYLIALDLLMLRHKGTHSDLDGSERPYIAGRSTADRSEQNCRPQDIAV